MFSSRLFRSSTSLSLFSQALNKRGFSNLYPTVLNPKLKTEVEDALTKLYSSSSTLPRISDSVGEGLRKFSNLPLEDESYQEKVIKTKLIEAANRIFELGNNHDITFTAMGRLNQILKKDFPVNISKTFYKAMLALLTKETTCDDASAISSYLHLQSVIELINNPQDKVSLTKKLWELLKINNIHLEKTCAIAATHFNLLRDTQTEVLFYEMERLLTHTNLEVQAAAFAFFKQNIANFTKEEKEQILSISLKLLFYKSCSRRRIQGLKLITLVGDQVEKASYSISDLIPVILINTINLLLPSQQSFLVDAINNLMQYLNEENKKSLLFKIEKEYNEIYRLLPKKQNNNENVGVILAPPEAGGILDEDEHRPKAGMG